MSEIAQSPGSSNKPFPLGAKPFAPDDEAALREALKRCSPSTFEAAVQFRKTGNADHMPAVVIGVIERFVEPDLRAKLKDADDDLRLIEDLGIDSLTMMEIVILVEDVLQLTINNDELRNLRTVGDVKTFIDCKIRGLPLPRPTKFLPIEHIGAVMPVQPPFLFLNEASVSSTGANGKYKITGPGVLPPGSFQGQPRHAGLDHARGPGPARGPLPPGGSPDGAGQGDRLEHDLFTGCEGVRAHRMCKPGDILTLSIKPKRMKMPLATFEGAIRVGQEKAVIAEDITLTFAYVESWLRPPWSTARPSRRPTSENAANPPLRVAINA
jgi:acyl carrier protein